MKTISNILLLCFAFFSLKLYAQSQPFPDLTKVKVATISDIYVYFDKKLCKIINKPSQTDSGFVDVLQTSFNLSQTDKILVRFCEGPSADPWFGFYRIEKDTLIRIGSSAGTSLFIPGTSFVYVSDDSYNTFDLKKKYAVSRDTVIEIEQPFYYVGLESETLQDITIYSDINKTNIVANLPKGSPVFIIANKGYRNYLLKTPFGLLGWFEIKYQYGETELKGIFNGE